ncbi:MAG TPA: adenosylcobinamide-GDP ribazoletransferase [Egibacteraceae bacterium]
MIRPDHAIRDAIAFLTVLPVGRRHAAPGPEAVAAFPLVGLLVGLAWAVVAVPLSTLQTNAVPAAFVLVVDAALTGMLHLDAIADVTDGVVSRRDPDEAVAIMREPTVGAAGAAAVVLGCLLRFAILIVAVDAAQWLLAAPIAGRTAMAWLLWLLPVRDGSSLAALFSRPGPGPVAVATGLAVLLLAVLAPAASRGLLALAVAIAVALLYAAWWRHRFGGVTGDGVGAGGFAAETAALLAVLSLQTLG